MCFSVFRISGYSFSLNKCRGDNDFEMFFSRACDLYCIRRHENIWLFFFFHFRASHPVPQNFLSSRIASPESKRKMLFCPNFFPACLQIFRSSPTRGACKSYPESLAVMRDFDRSAQSCKSDISTLLSPSDNVMNYLFFSQFSSSFSSDMIKKTLTSC